MTSARSLRPLRIARLRALCREATPERAVLVLRATLDSDGARTVCLRSTLGGLEHVAVQPLATGANEVEWTLTGGGAVSEAATLTDDQGQASVTRTLGTSAGGQATEAAVAGLEGSPVVFQATAAADA